MRIYQGNIVHVTFAPPPPPHPPSLLPAWDFMPCTQIGLSWHANKAPVFMQTLFTPSVWPGIHAVLQGRHRVQHTPPQDIPVKWPTMYKREVAAKAQQKALRH